MKQIIILIGPKGSGKTTIGQAIASKLGIRFLDVEKHLIEYISKHQIDGNDLPNHGFDIEEVEIRSILESENSVIFEATGSSKYFMHYYNLYKTEFEVVPIKLECSFETCLGRLNKRNHSNNFEVSIEKIKEIYEYSTALNLDWFQVKSTEDDVNADGLIHKLEMVLRK